MPLNIPPDNSAWIRIIKNANMLSEENEVELLFYVWKRDPQSILDLSYQYDVIEVLRNPLRHFKYLKKIISGDYDLIYFNIHIPLFYLFINFFGTPIILDKHGDYLQEYLMYNDSSFSFELIFRKIVEWTDINFSDKIICVSQQMINTLIKKGITKNKLFYLTNGVDLNFLKKSSPTFNPTKPKNKLVFSYIGAFHKWQGVDNFIKAAKLLKNDPEILFLIVGGMKEGKEGNISYVPHVSPKDVIKYYSISDILVLPRPSHPATEVAAPTKLAEYAATGKPILTTNVGDAAFFVKKYKCGIVIENNSPENIIKGINIFKSKQKNELLEMGKNSKKMAKYELSYEKMYKDITKLIRNYS